MASYSDRRSAPTWRRNRAKSLGRRRGDGPLLLAPRTPARVKAIALERTWPLLAHGAGDKIVGPAAVRLSRAAGNQHLRRTGLGGIHVEARALFIALALAKPVGADLSVGGAVGGNRTHRAHRHHGGWICKVR